ncbi:hypothetical protein [Acidovorax delafieldii]|uniref:hypothetical protein n=1 Tax=Acidovorax delafieldii TaxID=47920 RepID=UPI003ECE80AB
MVTSLERFNYYSQQDGKLLGHSTLNTKFESTDIDALHPTAVAVETLFAKHGLSVDRSESLSSMVNAAKNRQQNFDILAFFQCMLLERIAPALLELETDPKAAFHLRALLDGSLNLLSPQQTQSKAKDTLWELEMLSLLRRSGFAADLLEPDISFPFENHTMGVACKKIYSQKNAYSVIKRAISQIEKHANLGIVALNIDDLYPTNHIMQVSSHESGRRYLEQLTGDFFRDHEPAIRKYLEPGRAMACFVSCSAIVDSQKETPRFCNTSSFHAWHIPGRPNSNDELLQIFVETVNRNLSQ